MIGHEFAPSETNYNHWVATCSCGWIGPITGWQTTVNPKTKRDRRNRELTIATVKRTHDEHLRDVTADIEARSARVIERNAEAVSRLIPTMLRPGRFGAGN